MNVHNIGAHLVFYVRQWGPIFACIFLGFEDWNAALLQSVHGTKDVTRQILCYSQAQLRNKSSFSSMPSGTEKMYISKMLNVSKHWKVAAVAEGCTISGAVVTLGDGPADQIQLILGATGVKEVSDLQKEVLRVQYKKEKLYSSEYRRLKKRICYVVLTKDDQIVAIKYFIFNALAQTITLKRDCFMFEEAGRHILRVVESSNIVVIPVVKICALCYRRSFRSPIEPSAYFAIINCEVFDLL